VFLICAEKHISVEITARKGRECADIPLGDTGCQYDIFSLFSGRNFSLCFGFDGRTRTKVTSACILIYHDISR
jgi:hypothetical protein